MAIQNRFVAMKQDQRIEIGTAGFGEASAETVEQRARKIAIADGRTMPNELDRAEARREILHPGPEEESAEESIPEGDRPDAGVAPASEGTRAEVSQLDDDSNIAENLVQEGIEEADLDTRAEAGRNAGH